MWLPKMKRDLDNLCCQFLNQLLLRQEHYFGNFQCLKKKADVAPSAKAAAAKSRVIDESNSRAFTILGMLKEKPA